MSLSPAAASGRELVAEPGTYPAMEALALLETMLRRAARTRRGDEAAHAVVSVARAGLSAESLGRVRRVSGGASVAFRAVVVAEVRALLPGRAFCCPAGRGQMCRRGNGFALRGTIARGSSVVTRHSSMHSADKAVAFMIAKRNRSTSCSDRADPDSIFRVCRVALNGGINIFAGLNVLINTYERTDEVRLLPNHCRRQVATGR